MLLSGIGAYWDNRKLTVISGWFFLILTQESFIVLMFLFVITTAYIYFLNTFWRKLDFFCGDH